MQNLLRPNQVEQLKEEEYELEAKLLNPNTNKREAGGQLRRVREALSKQVPTEFKSSEKDAAVKRSAELLDDILVGMPSKEEMRKNPPGAVSKHRMWEKRNKDKIVEWKNIQLRLNAGTEDLDICNLEKFRPTRSTLNMDNAQISGRDYYMPSGAISAMNVASDEDKAQMQTDRTKLIKKAIDTKDESLARFLGIDLGLFGDE